MAHINSTEVQTAEGVVTVTKTSTHRDYALVSIAEFADGTQVVLSWHLSPEAAARYANSAEARRIAEHAAKKREVTLTSIALLPVTVTLTGKDAKQAEAGEIALEAAANLDAEIDAHNAKVAAQAPKAQSGTTGNTCRCGCGEAIGAKSQYRPGHDARHAGQVARDIFFSSSRDHARVTADSDLGSDALIAKAHAMADRLIAKQARKQAK